MLTRLLLLLVALWPATVAQAETWTNPLVQQRADPQVFRHQGLYYLVATVPEYDRIELRRAPTLEGLRQAEPKVIWRKKDRGPMSWHIWAPELHRIGDKWYLYFTAGKAEAIWEIRLWVLENAAEDPFADSWVERGQIKTPWDSFSLDATVFSHRDRWYLLWTQSQPDLGKGTNIYLAPLADPLTLGGAPTLLSKPDYPWEKRGHLVNEAPAVLVRHGKVFVTFSASATDANYCLGLLWASADADLTQAANWHKLAEPVLTSSSANGQFGPGHNSFTVAEDGETDILVYHARNYEKIEGEPLRNPDRHTRAQRLSWSADGFPVFDPPVADGVYSLPPRPATGH